MAVKITSLGKNTARITGLTIPGNDNVTIGLDGSVADHTLPANFPAEGDSGLTLSQLIQVTYVHTNPGGGGESRHIHVDKTDSPFTITITNDQGADSSPLELYVRYLHSETR